MLEDYLRQRREERERQRKRNLTAFEVGLWVAMIWKAVKWVGMFFLIGAIALTVAVAKGVFGQR